MKKFKKMDPILSDVLIKIINRYEEVEKNMVDLWRLTINL
jgi:hypothetical protein